MSLKNHDDGCASDPNRYPARKSGTTELETVWDAHVLYGVLTKPYKIASEFPGPDQ